MTQETYSEERAEGRESSARVQRVMVPVGTFCANCECLRPLQKGDFGYIRGTLSDIYCSLECERRARQEEQEVYDRFKATVMRGLWS